MAGPTDYLAEWFERFIKNRDLVFRKIAEVKRESGGVTVRQKDGKKIHYTIHPFPDSIAKTALEIQEEQKGIVLYNTQHNFDTFLKEWEQLEKIPNLTIHFINPFSKLDKRWAVNPKTHSLITDKEALEPGLRSMLAMVDLTTQKEIEKLTA